MIRVRQTTDLKTDKGTRAVGDGMDPRKPPPTAEGWFALHDFRTVDWDAWRNATESERTNALAEGRAYLEAAANLDDAAEGSTATYAVNGHKADVLVLHLRPTLADLNALERRFERTALAGMTNRATSFVSVTEVSGYTTPAQLDETGLDSIEDDGLRNYLQTRLHPPVPDATYICFYPMRKRRDPEYNWYDLPFSARREHIKRHGEIGREYSGRVTQMITGSIGLDDWEWGVTLWSNDPTAFKDLLYEMRFDPSTSRFAEFGAFYTGERLPLAQLRSFFRGEHLTDPESPREHHAGVADQTPSEESTGAELREQLASLGVLAGKPHGEDVHALVLYSTAPADELLRDLTGLRENFEHYDTHVQTALYQAAGEAKTAIASIWETASAAQTAAGFLSDLPGVIDEDATGDGFGTMGMFYTVHPEHRQEFVDTFDAITDALADMNGHHATSLWVNVEDDNDMFISSQWQSKDDALAFFRSETFRDTVAWGRDILADRPRHVFFE